MEKETIIKIYIVGMAFLLGVLFGELLIIIRPF